MSDNQRPRHVPGSVRHAEKRRSSTCRFADAIATVSVDAYRACVSESFRERQKQTCMATIVAHFASDGHLQVMGLGVGTKFLTESILREEERGDGSGSRSSEGVSEYGSRVRDCHAEVLARRAFRRQISLEMKMLQDDKWVEHPELESTYRPILRLGADSSFKLADGVTLHFYSSSAPCGNAVLKKFAKMEKETFNGDLGVNEWPMTKHEPVQAHSIRLGQLALLVKKDSTAEKVITNMNTEAKGKVWPANQNDDWCPPGTSIVAFRQGSLHSCSDKVCRWNCLGLQGSLLASLLEMPLYMSSITVGRKLTGCICRRAICCRADGFGQVRKRKHSSRDGSDNSSAPSIKYSLQHPAVMGTGVYMDDTGMIDMSNAHEREQDVRFDCSLAWVWWPLIGCDRRSVTGETSVDAECIDCHTGFACDNDEKQQHETGEGSKRKSNVSLVSSSSLVQLFALLMHKKCDGVAASIPTTLKQLRALKRNVSQEYEAAKDNLLSKHRVFRQWRRRGYESSQEIKEI